MRVRILEAVAVLGLVGAIVCAVLALDGCYRCDSPGEPRCPAVQPDYPPPAPLGAPQDAGRE